MSEIIELRKFFLRKSYEVLAEKVRVSAVTAYDLSDKYTKAENEYGMAIENLQKIKKSLYEIDESFKEEEDKREREWEEKWEKMRAKKDD